MQGLEGFGNCLRPNSNSIRQCNIFKKKNQIKICIRDRSDLLFHRVLLGPFKAYNGVSKSGRRVISQEAIATVQVREDVILTKVVAVRWQKVAILIYYFEDGAPRVC